ncbi:YrrS family protein [Natribacillus halophilus]|uniref:DUF1510 domain-containing protein n=1 Tax=Natribacillus halophilus TaxID=549003 RepID=A0A1G8P2U1_9BACI|nr:YrrS family protein [Natribacillus halophilus]SDI86130.1 Protein of unknown function [Natribacillus halophilus]
MDDPNQFRGESRRELRKRKTMNRLMNTAIGVVVVLIGFFLFALVFQDDDEPVADDEFEEDEPDVEEDVEEDVDEEEAPDEEATEPEESPDNGLDDEDGEDGEDEDGGNDTETDEEGDNGDELSPPEDGDFEPIGTEQEDFEPNFDSDSQNWSEMIAAIEYATGISEDEWSTLHWLGSGDGPDEAEGTIEHDGTEYVVTMEWVDDEGWMPTNVEEN